MMQNQENIFTKVCSASGKELFFYGAEHGNNPESAQFVDIQQEWNSFMERAGGEKVAIGEIPVPAVVPAEYVEAIRMHGEAGALYWCAKNSGVDAFCPEPDIREQRRSLCEMFPAEHVVYALVLQNLASWFRHQRNRTFDEAVSFTLQREASFADIYGFAPDREWFDRIHALLHGDKEISDKEFLWSVSDPRKQDTEVNKIVAARTQVRNDYILLRVVKEWEAGKSIFIVYGRGHLDALRGQLEDVLKCASAR